MQGPSLQKTVLYLHLAAIMADNAAESWYHGGNGGHQGPGLHDAL
jgi:hypothetical protein